MQKVVLSATAWSTADVILRQGLQFVISVVLARLLTPQDFGVIAMMQLFVGIAGAFASGGLTWALIQRQDVTVEDESTVFWLNLLVGALMALLFWQSGPWIAFFYNVPVLEPLAAIMALTVLITALGGVQEALFSKALNFRPMMLAGGVAVLMSGAVAIWMAWTGYGVWALAAQAMVSALVTTAMLWMASSWRASFIFSFASARRLYGFGGFMLFASLLDALYLRFYAIVGGRLYGANEVGFYSRAETTSLFPSGIIVKVVGRVTFPLFSRNSDDINHLQANVRTAVQSVMLVHAPIMLGLAAIAEPVVLTLFGKQWLPASPFLQVLCLTGLLLPVHVLNHHALLSLGHAKLFFHLELFKKGMGFCILILVAGFGAIAIAWGAVMASAFFFFVNARYLHKFLNYGALSQLRDISPMLLLAITMAGVVAAIDHQQDGWSPLMRLTVEVPIGIFVYSAGILLLRPRWLIDAAGMLLAVREETDVGRHKR